MSAVPSDTQHRDEVHFEPLLANNWLEEVLRIEARAYSHPWSRANFLDTLHSGYQAQLLVAGQRVLGYFVAMNGVDEAHLLNITVAPEYQGQGLARMMLDALCVWARGSQAHMLWLEVRVSNVRALKVYEHYGFRPVGKRRDYYPAEAGRREDAVVMSLRL